MCEMMPSNISAETAMVWYGLDACGFDDYICSGRLKLGGGVGVAGYHIL